MMHVCIYTAGVQEEFHLRVSLMGRTLFRGGWEQSTRKTRSSGPRNKTHLLLQRSKCFANHLETACLHIPWSKLADRHCHLAQKTQNRSSKCL